MPCCPLQRTCWQICTGACLPAFFQLWLKAASFLPMGWCLKRSCSAGPRPPACPPMLCCSKLKVVLASSGKRPGGPGRPPTARRQLPGDLGDLTAVQLLEALAPVLPAIRCHLDAGEGPSAARCSAAVDSRCQQAAPKALSHFKQPVCLPPAWLANHPPSARCAPALLAALRCGAACSVINDSLSEEATAEHDREHFWDVAASAGATQVGQVAWLRAQMTGRRCNVAMQRCRAATSEHLRNSVFTTAAACLPPPVQQLYGADMAADAVGAFLVPMPNPVATAALSPCTAASRQEPGGRRTAVADAQPAS